MAERDFIESPGVTAAAGTTKARIERAALILFCQRGVDAVTTREIAGASGVSEGALYRHYPSKASLSETMFFAIHKRLAREVRFAAESADKIDEKARAIVHAYTRIADEDWTLFSYHLLTTHRFLPYADKTDKKTGSENPVAVVEDVVSTAMKKGELPAGDVRL
ncbi:MAG: helix-turn-helix domain-containing protein, partial [Pseudomonadota bacterium]